MQRALFIFLCAALGACGSSAPTTNSPQTAPVSSTPSVLVRCDAELQRTGAEPISVAGWGDDEAEARENAALMAGHLAERLDRTSIWLQLAANPPESSSRLDEGFATQPYEGDAPAGWRISDRACQQESIDSAARVTAVWSESPSPYESNSIAAAVEGARRLSCGAQWGDSLVQFFSEHANLGPDERAERTASAGDAIAAQAVGCVADGSYQLEAARHPATSDELGPRLCQVTLAPSRRAQFVGQAVGGSRAMAIHRASLRTVQVAFATADGDIAGARLAADPAERAMLIANALTNAVHAERFAALTGTEIARCASIGSDAASWGSRLCGPEETLPANRLCASRRGSMAVLARRAFASLEADDYQRMVVRTWGQVQECVADCLAGFEVASASEFRDTHAAHCGSEAAARATLQRGVEGQRAAEVFHCLSHELAGMIFEGFAERPERVWEGLQELLSDESRLVVQPSDGAFRIALVQR